MTLVCRTLGSTLVGQGKLEPGGIRLRWSELWPLELETETMVVLLLWEPIVLHL